jgi:hypothetical protein
VNLDARSGTISSVTKAFLVALAAIVLVACGSSGSDDAVRKTFRSGVAQIPSTPDPSRLQVKLKATIHDLERGRARSTASRRGRALALAGFRATLRGVETQLSMRIHDSGKLEAAVRDAKRADRYLNRGARLLRAAGRELGVRVGLVNGR